METSLQMLRLSINELNYEEIPKKRKSSPSENWDFTEGI